LDVKLYALSTCGWCKKAKNLLEDNDIAYDVVYVDQLDKEEKEQVLVEVRKWNPRCSFPTVVVDDKESVAGFKEARLKEILGL
jgi:glutaredoxin